MNISELSLRRPVLAIVLNLVIVLFGVIGFKFLGVRDYPAIDPPNINVRVKATRAPMLISLSRKLPSRWNRLSMVLPVSKTLPLPAARAPPILMSSLMWVLKWKPPPMM